MFVGPGNPGCGMAMPMWDSRFSHIWRSEESVSYLALMCLSCFRARFRVIGSRFASGSRIPRAEQTVRRFSRGGVSFPVCRRCGCAIVSLIYILLYITNAKFSRRRDGADARRTHTRWTGTSGILFSTHQPPASPRVASSYRPWPRRPECARGHAHMVI